jgi:hypothetical protein
MNDLNGNGRSGIPHAARELKIAHARRLRQLCEVEEVFESLVEQRREHHGEPTEQDDVDQPQPLSMCHAAVMLMLGRGFGEIDELLVRLQNVVKGIEISIVLGTFGSILL